MALEDYTTYTEVDTDGVWSVDSGTQITGADVDADISDYIYKDFTADHFNALDADWETTVDATSDAAANTSGCAFSVSTVGSVNTLGTSDVIAFTKTDANNRQEWFYRGGGATAFDSYVHSGGEDTTFYLTMTRVADSDTITLKIYSDSGRSSLVDTLTVSGYGTGTKYRYCYAASSLNLSTAGRNWDGTIANLDLNEAVAGPTTVKTVDTAAIATVKTMNTAAIATIKTINTAA